VPPLTGPAGRAPSAAFDGWLSAALALPPEPREQALLAWEQAPFARVCHPQEDHLVPLFVALGAAGADPATCIYNATEVMGGVTASSFAFGLPAN
jgi:aromatic ring-opening dioxygenase catalytic subunit (LigB family)